MDQIIYLLTKGILELFFIGLLALGGWSVGRTSGAIITSGLVGTMLSCGEAYNGFSSNGDLPTQSIALQVMLISVIIGGGAFALVWKQRDYIGNLHWAPDFKSPFLSISFACITAYLFSTIAIATWFGLLYIPTYSSKVMSSAIVFAVILWLGLVPKEAPASTLELTDVVGAKKVKVRAPIGDQPYENLSSPHGQKATYVRHEIDPYAAAAAEVRSKNMHAAIWARAMVEGGGVEGPVQAAYIKLRVAQLASTQGEGKLSE